MSKSVALTRDDTQPPLLDRNVFFGDPAISSARLSPNGRYLAFLRPFEGTRNIWIKPTESSFDEARPLTTQQVRPVSSFFWSRDNKFVLFILDNGGDENFNIYALEPEFAYEDSVPQAKNLTNLKGVRVLIYHICRNEPDKLFIGINDRDPAWHDLYKLNISTGKLTLIRENNERFINWIFDWDDQIRLAVKNTEAGNGELWSLEEEKPKLMLEWSVLDSVNPLFFDKDNQSLFLTSNKGENIDLSALFLMHIPGGGIDLVERDPENKVDFGGISVSEISKEIISTSYTDDRTRRYFKKEEYERMYESISSKYPEHEVSFYSPTLDENLWLVNIYSDVDPGTVFLYNREEQSLKLQYKNRPEIPREALAPMRSVRYPSSDGLEIQAYLTLPKGREEKQLPLIIMPHGGPWVRDYWGYNGYVQFLANRGYAVLQPNFRISTGFGKKFLNAGNRQWGDKMQDDLSWGVKYLVEMGIADKHRIGIFGGSYGGYAALAGLAFTPDLYACGVSFVGPSNLITLLESIPPYWEAGRKMFHIRMGDPTTEEGREQLIRQSPLYSAEKIKSPLMVVQGQNDPRVKKAESDQIVTALKERGFPVVYLNAPDEGHGFSRPENTMAFIAAMEKFLAEYLGGRHQSDMPEKIKKRLAEITVDLGRPL
ncbi:MAG: S9 family peptidase [Saprospirales bacterium]|nr:MAG: S9 family peptidase [Saprospirales bacterium]